MQRFIKCRVTNMDLMKGSKNRDIYTNNADGTNVTIQSGSEVELTEYAYNNLKDAVQIIMKQGSKDPNNLNAPAQFISTNHSKIDIVEMSPFYTKDENGKIIMPETKEGKTIENLEAEIQRLKQKFADQDKRKEDFEKSKEEGFKATQEEVDNYNKTDKPKLTVGEQAIINKPLWITGDGIEPKIDVTSNL